MVVQHVTDGPNSDFTILTLLIHEEQRTHRERKLFEKTMELAKWLVHSLRSGLFQALE